MKKTILITGAGRGIGRATALKLASAGHRFVIASRTPAELASLASEILSLGGEVLVVECDVSDQQSVQELIQTTQEWSQQPLDMVICAAGIARVGNITDLSLEAWNESLQVNLTGTFLCCQAAIPVMQAGGMIITLSSIAGQTGFPGWSAYSAAKFGLMGFTQALREEVRPLGIRVTTLIPGAVDTPLWQDIPGNWNRENMLQAEDVASTIEYLTTLPSYIQIDELMIGHIVGKL